MLSALLEEEVEFLVVGGYAVIAHGSDRTTGDIDFLVRPTVPNAARVWRALKRFGAPLRGVSEKDFSRDDVVYQIGVRPRRIALLTGISGVDFELAWNRRETYELDGLLLPILGLEDLLASKLASGRPRDRADARLLKRLLAMRPSARSKIRKRPTARRRGATRP